MEVPCSVDGCSRPAWKAGLCHGHTKRRTRGQPINVPLLERPRTPKERLLRAALRFAEAEEEVDYELALDNLRKSARLYAIACERRRRRTQSTGQGRL